MSRKVDKQTLDAFIELLLHPLQTFALPYDPRFSYKTYNRHKGGGYISTAEPNLLGSEVSPEAHEESEGVERYNEGSFPMQTDLLHCIGVQIHILSLYIYIIVNAHTSSLSCSLTHISMRSGDSVRWRQQAQESLGCPRRCRLYVITCFIYIEIFFDATLIIYIYIYIYTYFFLPFDVCIYRYISSVKTTSW